MERHPSPLHRIYSAASIEELEEERSYLENVGFDEELLLTGVTTDVVEERLNGDDPVFDSLQRRGLVLIFQCLAFGLLLANS